MIDIIRLFRFFAFLAEGLHWLRGRFAHWRYMRRVAKLRALGYARAEAFERARRADRDPRR